MSHHDARDRSRAAGLPGGPAAVAGRGHGSGVGRLRDVAVKGRAAQPLSGVNLDVEPGTLTLLLGGPENGVESVLLVLAGLLPIDSGAAEIAGVQVLPGNHGPNPTTEPQAWRHRVGFVPERPSAVGFLTVAENLALPAELADAAAADRARIGRLVHTLRLDGVRDRFPDELSDTQRRCLSLGQALAYAPDLLVVPDGPRAGHTEHTGHTQHPEPGQPGQAGQPGQPELPAPPEPPARALALALIDLVRFDGHTVVTALDDPAIRSAAEVIVQFEDGRVLRTERRGRR